MPRRVHRPAADGGFLLPLAASTSLVLVLSSLSLQAAALQARGQVQGGQRLRQAEDALMSAAQHWVAGAAGQLAGGELEGQTGQVGSVAYRLVAWEGPRWPEPAGLDGLQRSQAVATLELVPTAEQPRPLRAAFALELARPVAPAAGGVRLLALRELGLRGRAAQGVAP
ncbi:hypothetical protein [Cyanobium sp. FACHB-13342]|uniref:hypothetical protein n=1 Tax=Cyanobium sp. FACHB-13342 TaxID=2692793 RepID=UPI001680B96B|nr:hypothetical protein [Cyanobium sp. FACHB-13342]MBD2422756.1 hypothetical protein [Cyanobium sp. FACHB-13342]